MGFFLPCSRSFKAMAMSLFFLFQTMVRTDASLNGTVVMPMGANLPNIKISFVQREGEEVGLYTIQSDGLASTDAQFFKVEGPLSCVRLVSDNQAIVSGVAMATAMNYQNFFSVGETILFAVTNSKVSVISRITSAEVRDCWDPDWEDFILLDVTEGQIDFVA